MLNVKCISNKTNLSDRTTYDKLKITDKQSKTHLRNKKIPERNEPRVCNKPENWKSSVSSTLHYRIIDKDTLNALKNDAVVISAEEQRRANNLNLLNDERLKNESETRKAELRKYDNLYNTKGPKLTQLDEEAKKKANYLLNRAFELKQNEQDEIKQCNSLILGTKCLAIRCAQMDEKELIQKDMKQEERRLEELMAQKRILEAKQYKKAEENIRLKKNLQASLIKQQMKENEIARQWEAAKADEETKMHIDAAIEAQRAEVKDYKEKLIKQAILRKEFIQMNAQLQNIKKIEKELIKLEVQQIQEYNKKKNERETAFEEETKKQKMLKEKEISKIQASQKLSQDIQAAKDEMNALRKQDQVEKEWRKKEHEEALKKFKADEDLKEARNRQIQDQRKGHAFEIQREKEQFDKIITLNIEDIEKTNESERQYKMKVDEHQKNLLKQIKEKELEKIQERKKLFQEGITYQEEVAARNKLLHKTMQNKIEELKLHNLPSRYIQGIERQLKIKT